MRQQNQTPQLTVAAAHLLNAARASNSTTFDATALDQLLHPHLRYDQRGPNARRISPHEAFAELHAAALVSGTADQWTLR